jgi:malonate transporter MadM subunit
MEASRVLEILGNLLKNNGLIVAFAIVGLTMYLSYFISNKLTRGRIHGSAIAITLGLVLAYIGGVVTGGEKGLSDITLFSGIGLMGGGMLRDFAIVATAFGANFSEIKKAGVNGVLSLFVGVVLSFVVGVIIALAFGYRDAISLTTIGAGTATYIVGPVTGSAIGASSEVITLSIAAGLVKSILTMIGTPFIAKYIGLNNPRTAMVYGGIMGTTSGVAGGLAATDPKLVPYGAVTATFYTGLGCLLAPSVLFLLTKAIFA